MQMEWKNYKKISTEPQNIAISTYNQHKNY